jgi:uncharacterized membrane protein
MAHRHDHGSDDDRPFAVLALGVRVTVVVIGVAALIAVVVLWPRGDAPQLYEDGTTVDYVDATVERVAEGGCPGLEDLRCRVVDAAVTGGPDAGTVVTFGVLDTDLTVPELEAGDGVVLQRNAAVPEEFRYGFADFQRDAPLVALAVLFAVAVLVLGRITGVRALVGLAASLTVVLVFLLPAMLRAQPPLAVALAGTVVIAYIAVYVTHGVTTRTTIALFGTLGGALIVGALAEVFTRLARLTGLSDESALVLQVTAEAVDLRGLLVAGIVIGAMGVLDDVTMIQVSAVDELRAADPSMGPRELYQSAVRIGRDHIASTVNTLVLAYVGAGLPLLLLFLQSAQSIAGVAASEVVAVEIVRTLVGSIGLIVAIPMTTGLAAIILHRSEPAPRTARPATPSLPGPERPQVT